MKLEVEPWYLQAWRIWFWDALCGTKWQWFFWAPEYVASIESENAAYCAHVLLPCLISWCACLLVCLLGILLVGDGAGFGVSSKHRDVSLGIRMTFMMWDLLVSPTSFIPRTGCWNCRKKVWISCIRGLTQYYLFTEEDVRTAFIVYIIWYQSSDYFWMKNLS